MRSRKLFAALFLLAVPASSAELPLGDAGHWRLLGPFRGGWATCAAGVAGDPRIAYSGAAGGGVWKTTDAGRTWQPLDHGGAASIGAVAVAPSDPNVIYAGTGQVQAARYDVLSGDGVYRSDDAGATWRRVGLAASEQIGAILVDPRDPDVVLVAAQGHFFGPNAERGVFRSTDGGGSWTKTLFTGETTGAVDLASDPSAPDLVFAALWQVQRLPWQDYYMPTTGPGSGIYASSDGGVSWRRLEGGGLPAIELGRIGLAVTPGSSGRRVFALIDAKPGTHLYRSDDAGAHWTLVNRDRGMGGGAYMTRVTAAPGDPDVVYVMGQSIRRSTDGGATFTIWRGAPGGDDFHYLWIDPEDPSHFVAAADQGTIVSLDGGASWSSWYNQPTGQFYHVETDDRFPYWVYSGQQDSGTAAVASRSDYGQLTFRDWHPAGGDERGYVVPERGGARRVFTAGLGGRVSRWDADTGRVENVSVWPVSSYAKPPYDAAYRYTWYWPLVRDPVEAKTLYAGSQKVWRTTDSGGAWAAISDDLSGQTVDPSSCPRPVPRERATECGYGVVFSIAPSPLDGRRIWVGTDNGKVHLTLDGGASWKEVTPQGLEPWSKVSVVEASPTDAATAYLAVDRHRLDDRRPYVYVTRDAGKSWREVSAGLPADAYVYAVRQDLVSPDLLYAGTHLGAYVSFDGGGRWQRLGDLPTVDVTDLVLHGADLVAATQGRGLWVLDGVAPLRGLAAAVAAGSPVLFPPEPAIRLRANENRDTPLPQEEPVAANPPTGALLDYYLPAAASRVRLEIAGGDGRVVRRFASDAPGVDPAPYRYFNALWLGAPSQLATTPGLHRFVWDLRGERTPAIDYDYSIAATPSRGTAVVPSGALVLPGRYEARLEVDGAVFVQPVVVELDPRANVSRADLEAQAALHAEVAAALGELVARRHALEGEKEHAEEAAEASIDRRLKELEDLSEALAGLATDLEAADGPPAGGQAAVWKAYAARVEAAVRER